MFNSLVGVVNEEEKNELRTAFERKLALNDLEIALKDIELSEVEERRLIEKIKSDIISNNQLIDNWWKNGYNKHNWESKDNGTWTIDFETNEIYLVEATGPN
jgi:CXXX repeat modification system protein